MLAHVGGCVLDAERAVALAEHLWTVGATLVSLRLADVGRPTQHLRRHDSTARRRDADAHVTTRRAMRVDDEASAALNLQGGEALARRGDTRRVDDVQCVG